MKLTLETDRLLLRPFSVDDAEAMFNGWASDPEVTKYLTWNTHQNSRRQPVSRQGIMSFFPAGGREATELGINQRKEDFT